MTLKNALRAELSRNQTGARAMEADEDAGQASRDISAAYRKLQDLGQDISAIMGLVVKADRAGTAVGTAIKDLNKAQDGLMAAKTGLGRAQGDLQRYK